MFKYDGDISSIKKAVTYANSDILKMYVIDHVKSRASFDMSTASPQYISEQLDLFLSNVTVNIVTYKPFNRFTKAIGYYSPDEPTTIHFNVYKLTSDLSVYVGNFFHEIVHMMDSFDNEHSFGHGDNKPSGKANTAPYFIGNIAASYMRNKKNMNNTETAQIIYYVPWYKRLINLFRGK